jgi:flagella basal body P-ring formation protein FlgA
MKLLLLLLIVGINGYAIELACDRVNQSVIEKITDALRESYAEVQFEGLTINALGSELPTDCDYVSFEFPKRIDLSSDLIIRFDAHKNDLFQKRSTKIFRFKGHAKVLRASKILHRGDNVSKQSLVSGKIKLNKVNQHTISSIPPMAYQYRNYIDKDQVIESWMIEKKPDVKKGDLVSAVVKKEKITLTLDARILENGYIGDSVKLKLSKNNKILLGTLHDKKTVIISSL